VASEAVDDLVQDTLIACFGSSTRFRAEASFRSYVLGVARNQLFTHVRNVRRRQRDQRLDKTWVELCFSPGHEADEKSPAMLAHALSCLPERLRTPIEHFYFLGRSRPEIAASLQVPEGTVASRIRIARSHLRDMMEAPSAVHAQRAGFALLAVQAQSG
jgi:RNA polymerase sigma-70 factor (ECF subfamily)